MSRHAPDDTVLEPLFEASPKRFVAARDEVVASLRRAGRAGEAERVAKLRRPTASLWAVNQLARRAPDAIAALLERGASLRAYAARALDAEAAAEYVREGQLERRELAALATRAEALLAEAEQQATPVLLRQLTKTLHAAAIGDDLVRERLRRGRLLDEPGAIVGFGGLEAEEPAPRGRGATAKPEEDASPSAARTGRGQVAAGGTPAPSRGTTPAPSRGLPAPSRGLPPSSRATKATGAEARAAADRGATRSHARPEAAQHDARAAARAERERAREAELARRAAAQAAKEAERERRRAEAAARRERAEREAAIARAARLVAKRRGAVEHARAGERAAIELRAHAEAELRDAEAALAIARAALSPARPR